MIVRPKLHWLRLVFVWHGSVLGKILLRLGLNFGMGVIVVLLVVFKGSFPTGAATWLTVGLVIFMAASIQFYARWRRLRREREVVHGV